MGRKIDWAAMKSRNSKQKRGLKKAVECAGNCTNYANLLGVHKSAVHRWIYLEIKCPEQDLMSPLLAKRTERVLKIKGIAKQLCPSLQD